MSILQLETEIAEINRMVQEAEARKKAVAADLTEMIDNYFKSRVLRETNPDKRRDYAYFNATKQFDIISETTLRFSSRNRSGPISCEVLVSDLMDEYSATSKSNLC